MTITSTQKIITIGSSKGVTIPAKDLAALGATAGDQLRITAELVSKKDGSKHDSLMKEYDAFVAEYGQTLKNLADR